jgi:hypothetical protein
MHVTENFSASGFGELPRLRVNALALSARRYPCVTVFHGANYAANLRSKKVQSLKFHFFLRNSELRQTGYGRW